MDIKTVTVGLNLTFNLGDYSNVNPSAAFTVELQPGEDALAAAAKLQEECRELVHSEIDKALENKGAPPHFYIGPRATMLVWGNTGLNVLVKSNVADNRHNALPGYWQRKNYTGGPKCWYDQRADLLLQWAAQENTSVTRLDHLDTVDQVAEWAINYIYSLKLWCVIASNVQITTRWQQTESYEVLLAIPFGVYRYLIGLDKFYSKEYFPFAPIEQVNTWMREHHPRHQAEMIFCVTKSDVTEILEEQTAMLEAKHGYRRSQETEQPDPGGEPDDQDDDEDEDSDEE